MPDYLFEVSWEVCNKVGGIHTVLATKALLVLSAGNNHIVVVGNRKVDSLCRVLCYFVAAEEFFYLSLDVIYVNIANHHDSLKVGAIPFLILV